MFLKISGTRSGRKYLSYVQGYRDENGKTKHKTIKNIGWLDELQKDYDEPIKYFKEQAKKENINNITEHKIKNINICQIELEDKPKNLGYVVLKEIYKELGLKDLLSQKQKNLKIEYSLNDVLSFLVYMRIIMPSSKKKAYENKNMLFDKNDFSLDDVYSSLTLLNPLKEEIQKTMWHNTKNLYKRDTSTTFYDCTNYYFEIEYNDEDKYECDADGNVIKDENNNPVIKEKGLRKRGPEKNKRPDPIVEMGLLMDKTGIPLSYDLFPGNESEKKSLIPIIKRTKKDYDFGRTIVVADRGLNTSENIIHLSGTSLEQAKKLNGYVYGQSVRGADEEFKNWVLEQDYTTDLLLDENNNQIKFIHKSRIYPKKMRVIRTDKEKTKGGNDKIEFITVDQKQMVYYSQKYADKQKRDREKIILKAKDLVTHPDKYNKATSYGVAGYVNNLKFVKSTGEIADVSNLTINQERIDEEEKYDGYYSIVTSEENLTDIEIRDIYRGLSKIEETFKVTKTGLDGRPVWVSRNDHIESHFLTCFIALTIIRLLENKLKNRYSFNKILETIRNYNSARIDDDIYMQSYTNEIIKEFELTFNLNLSNKFKTLSEIKKMLK